MQPLISGEVGCIGYYDKVTTPGKVQGNLCQGKSNMHKIIVIAMRSLSNRAPRGAYEQALVIRGRGLIMWLQADTASTSRSPALCARLRCARVEFGRICMLQGLQLERNTDLGYKCTHVRVHAHHANACSLTTMPMPAHSQSMYSCSVV